MEMFGQSVGNLVRIKKNLAKPMLSSEVFLGNILRHMTLLMTYNGRENGVVASVGTTALGVCSGSSYAS